MALAPRVLNELFSVVSYNGNEQATTAANKEKFKIDHVLNSEVGVFHCSGKGTNFDLVLKASETFTLTNILVRKPPKGCTSPIRSGAIWISHEPPVLEDYSTKFNDFEKEKNTVQFEEKPSPAAFFLIEEDEKETQVELGNWFTGNYIHVKFISAAKADQRYKNIDVGYVGFVGFLGDQKANQFAVGPIPEQLGITGKGNDLPPPQEKIETEEMILLKSQLGKGTTDADGKFILNRKGEKLVLDEQHLTEKKTLYLKNIEDCEYIIDAPCLKVFLENCKRSTVICNGNIRTNTIEAWKVDDTKLHLNTKVFTFQLDICNNLDVVYAKHGYIQDLVWSGVENLKVTMASSKIVLETGLAQMKEHHPDLVPDSDQFITRFIDGKFKTELVVRLANGFPTTEREAAEFEAREARNKKLAEKKIKQLIKTSELSHRPKEEKKVGRNDPCPCGKGQKYKKCCGK
eukprot:TRINITY_DN3422_c0_g2_i1.p1 TRINITY_DN3422_c0_g2~~TRINITY_DN3422_c0_g2_i1.p1  ORF type:complete len:459 (+),score=129.58 TRINITY_DN3422_c0_g2_i1:50-1426(+)